MCVALAFLGLPSTAAAEFSIAGFSATTTSSQAGAHPDLSTSVELATVPGPGGAIFADGNVRTLEVQLPPGLQATPAAIPRCSQLAFTEKECQPEAQVGWAEVSLSLPDGEPRPPVGLPVFNLQPLSEDGPPEVGFLSGFIGVHLSIEVRAGGDYGLNVVDAGISRTLAVNAFDLTVWGVPGDPSHDPQRFDMKTNEPMVVGPLPRIAFFSNPTSCGGPLTLRAEATSYQEPNTVVEAAASLPPIGGCGKVEFRPTLRARPTTDVADSPSGLELDVGIPQNLDPDGLATAQLRDAALTLPEGLVVNPAAANGLEACSPEQVASRSCPGASSIGSVEVVTPFFDEPLGGTIFLATPFQNPFGSLLAVYLSIQGHGVDLALPGKLAADSETGRLTLTFEENPQLPVEHLKLHIFKGSRALLRTPAICGTYATTSSLTPWSAPASGPAAAPEDEYAIVRAPGGGDCPRSQDALPSSPSFEAGSTAPIAGAFRPFVVNLGREDGAQQFGAVTVTPPPGLLAKLAGVESCPELALSLAASRAGRAEEASPSCPAASRVGDVFVEAGAGPEPYVVAASAYLAGPYKGAPFSLAIVAPAVAGPFDLGTAVVRVALYFDPGNAGITARSDPIPSILGGIPLDVRAVSVRLDRSDFTLNPTNCDPASVGGALLPASGAAASLTSRFQVGECGRLRFKPRLTLELAGPAHRSAHPALTATLRMPKGSANVSKAAIVLPKTEFLDSARIRGVCSRQQSAERRCPAASLYGRAKALSPLLDEPLEGPVYLRGSNHRLPDLVASLDGQVHIDLAARVDSVRQRVRVTFAELPDVPVSKLVLRMRGGSGGLLVNNTAICPEEPRVAATFVAQNGKRSGSRPRAKVACAAPRQP